LRCVLPVLLQDAPPHLWDGIAYASGIWAQVEADRSLRLSLGAGPLP
jgi:hypothetical protein